MIIFVVGDEKRRYHLHRKLVQSATLCFNIAPPSIAEIDPDLRMLLDEDTEIFDEFVAWLYNRDRSWNVEERFVDLVKLVKIYVFALMWHIDPLKSAIMKALVKILDIDFDAFFATIETVFEEANNPYRYRITQVLDAVSRELVSFKRIGVDKLLDMYALSIKWGCNRLKNIIMDTLQDTLVAEAQLLTLDQIKKVFENLPSSPNERLRRFCVALYHHQRFSDEGQLSIQDASDYYVECDNFILDYMEFEQEVMFCKISDSYTVGDDPRDRKLGSFPQCYFHVHDSEKNEKCHMTSDKQVTFAV